MKETNWLSIDDGKHYVALYLEYYTRNNHRKHFSEKINLILIPTFPHYVKASFTVGEEQKTNCEHQLKESS